MDAPRIVTVPRGLRWRPGAAVIPVVILALAACDPHPGGAGGASAEPVAADHHVHVLSPELIHDWQALGVPFSRPDSAYTSVTAIFGGRPVHAFLVSMAHVYGSREFRRGLELSLDAEHGRVRHANDHVAREVARAPASYVGFCSVHLLRPYAAAEIERCRDDLGLAGLKLHLPASGIDLADRAHLELLARVSSDAARDDRPLLVHLAPVDGELREDGLRAFLDHVVEPNPGLRLYLAHLGGNGGYRASARRAVRVVTAYLHASDANADRTIYLELSGALLERTTDGVPASRRSDARALAADLRTLGLDRVVFGSDYPVFDAGSYAAFLEERLPLSSAELAQIMGNRWPGWSD
jgi:uncharacterized protein